MGGSERGTTEHSTGPCGPSSTDFNSWLEKNPYIGRRIELSDMAGIGYEIWRQAWMAAEMYHRIRKA